MFESGKKKKSLRIWDLNCTAISLILAHGIPIGKLRSLAQFESCGNCAKNFDDDAWVLQYAHRACHKRSEKSVMLERYLNERYREDIEEVRSCESLEFSRRLAERHLTPSNCIGAIWALVTDPEKNKRNFGQRMLHALILKGVNQRKPDSQFGEPFVGLTGGRPGSQGELN